jgi:hypothetical protein
MLVPVNSHFLRLAEDAGQLGLGQGSREDPHIFRDCVQKFT